MIPTNELRFVEREVTEQIMESTGRRYTVRVLQQRWVDENVRGFLSAYEWRDVPLVKEWA